MPRFEELIDRVSSECVAVRVRLVNRVVTNTYDDALRPFGLKVSQMNVLVETAKLGLARPAAISAALHLEPSTLSRNLERMRNKGWIEVVPQDDDARAQPFRLTETGERLLRSALPAWEVAQATTEELLGQGVVQAIRRAAKRVSTA